MSHIISASRRTDIPRYFADWFRERRRAGFAEFRNVFGVRGRASLLDRDVSGYLFWTRYAAPFHEALRELHDAAIPYAFQYTITGFDRAVEPHVPSVDEAVSDFLAVAEALPDPRCIQWRYDPIVLSAAHPPDWHRAHFGALARALRGATVVVNTSFVEPYAKTIRRMDDESVRYRRFDPSRHKTAARRDPPPLQIAEEAAALIRDLSAIARAHDMELRSCCDPDHGLPPSQCCSPELFEPYAAAFQAESLPPAPSRSRCRCVRSIDIGTTDTCVAGCRYCYAVTSHRAATRNFRAHDPEAPALR